MIVAGKWLLVTLTLLATLASAQTTGFHSLVRQVSEAALSEKGRVLQHSLQATRFESGTHAVPESIALKPCEHRPKVVISTPMRAGQQRLRVSCSMPRWSVFVRGYIRLYKPVLVSLRNLAPGQRPGQSSIKLEERDLGLLRRGYLASYDELAHQQINRTVRAGSVITPLMLEPERLVHRGDKVTLIAQAGAMSVSAPGIAMDDGSLGRQVRVRNQSSGKIVRGTVSGTGTVTVK